MEDKLQELNAEKERILAQIAESEKHIEHHKKTVHWDKKRLRLVEMQLEELTSNGKHQTQAMQQTPNQ